MAIEKIYPCIRIKWRPGRGTCGPEDASAPGASIQNFTDFLPFLTRYGFTQREFALLLAGTHGLNLATIHTDIKNELPMARVNSVKQYIIDSLTATWQVVTDAKPQTPMPFIYRGETTEGPVFRIPTDMIFYPSSIQRATGPKTQVLTDNRMIPVETELRKIALQTDYQVQKEFGRVFAKMLEVGMPPPSSSTRYFPETRLEDDIEEVQECLKEPGFSL
jgi:hypothetical protein